MTPTTEVLYGGTFDPVHCGHLAAARRAREMTGASRLWFIPNAQPPHRGRAHASDADRLAMLECAIATLDEPAHFGVSPAEIERGGTSYTMHTLEHWARNGHRLFFLIGADSLRTLNTWYRWRELTDFCHVLVATRPGFDTHDLDPAIDAWIQPRLCATMPESDELHGKVILLPELNFAISSSGIRQQLAHGVLPTAILPNPVLRYIQQKHLYSVPNQRSPE